ncbi:MAG: Holliday junction resolvase RuvX [Patescibacteria group bacterium]|nr:Holliday junction resolvase RuvX [Patescibacteria group bacterium]
MKILGIDYGEKRIGLALSDDLGSLAHEFEVVANWNNEDLIEYLRNLVITEDIEKIVIGLPLNMSGEETYKAQDVREFAAMLENQLDREIIFEDERWTTKMVDKVLREMKISQKEARVCKDMVAAKYILQSYLDREKDN